MGILKFFNKSKSNEDTALNDKIKKTCISAVEFAQDFRKNFDYSQNSIIDLEEILDYYSKDLQKATRLKTKYGVCRSYLALI